MQAWPNDMKVHFVLEQQEEKATFALEIRGQFQTNKQTASKI